MKEEALNSLLLRTKINKNEMLKIASIVTQKKKRLGELAKNFEKDPSVELSLNYLLLGREVQRLERVKRIINREKHKEIENRWILDGKAESAEDIAGFRKITKKYYDVFPSLSFTSREVPIEYYSHVQAVEECGLMEIGSSLIESRKGSLYYVRKKDVLHLLASGMMKIVENKK